LYFLSETVEEPCIILPLQSIASRCLLLRSFRKAHLITP